ncbi:MAG: hypothetical protein WBW00_00470, partial [Pseudolabrys sp.]
MKANKFLITAILVITIGAPIAGFVGDIKLPLSTIPTGEPIAFFHGLGAGPSLKLNFWIRTLRFFASRLADLPV